MNKTELKEKILSGSISIKEIRDNADKLKEVFTENVVIPKMIKGKLLVFTDYKGSVLKVNRKKIEEVQSIVKDVYNNVKPDIIFNKIIKIGMSVEMMLIIHQLINDSIELYESIQASKEGQNEEFDEMLKNANNKTVH